MKKPNKYGGGAQTNANGLLFEQTTSLNNALIAAGYTINNYEVSDNQGKTIGLSVPKAAFNNYFLKNLNGIDPLDYNSKEWLPDDCFINYDTKTVYIIEKKFQSSNGSVDEKLAGCEFKKLEYSKICKHVNYKVEYIYIFSDWFRDTKYKNYLDYIMNKDCKYFFNKIPLSALGLY